MEDAHSHSNPDRSLRLTPRERRVLELISKQFSQTDIGTILEVETNTLDALIKRIVKKMDARSPSDAAMTALVEGLIGPNTNRR